MTEPEKWEDIRYKYVVTLTKHEDVNLYKGFSSRIVADNYSSRKLHAIHLPSDQVSDYRQKLATTSNHTFKPFLNIKANGQNLEDSTIAVGRYIGIPLLAWMSDRNRSTWEVDKKGNYLRLGKDWRDVGRWLGGPVYEEHCADRFIGNLLNSTYVVEELKKVVFVKDPLKQATMTLDQGIQEDLTELHKLVKWLENTFPVNDSNIQHKHHDINVFYDLFPASLPASVEDLKELSYFICHNFLYYDIDERFGFCASYRRLRSSRSSDFSSVKLEHVNFISDTWYNSLTPKGAFESVFYYLPTAHGDRYGLIHFHRSLEEHYEKEAIKKKLPVLSKAEMDYELLVLFREAIPRAFNALYKSNIPHGHLIKTLKTDRLKYT